MRLFHLALLCLPLFTGCLFVNVKTPLDTDLNRTQLGTEVGTSESYELLWVAAWGDSGTQAAAVQGGLSEINHADQETFIILFGLYARYRTVLYGNLDAAPAASLGDSTRDWLQLRGWLRADPLHDQATHHELQSHAGAEVDRGGAGQHLALRVPQHPHLVRRQRHRVTRQ